MNRETMLKIDSIMEAAHKKVKTILQKEYPYLYFHISPDGEVSLWVKIQNHSAMAIIPSKKLRAGNLMWHNVGWLNEINEKVKPVSLEPDKYFYCTECGEVKERTEFFDSVFAGYYCKECAKKPPVEALIKQSYEKGFYD